MTKQNRYQALQDIASEWKRYAETLDDNILKQEAEILEKIACDYGEVALQKFHKDAPEGTEEESLDDERKGAPVVGTEQQLSTKRQKFSK
jgi:hypothetical protein